MNRRTFALLAAVITFTVGIVLAKLSLPNLFKTPPPVVIKEVQLSNYRITGPYEYEDLSIFLIHGPDAPGNGRYTPLQEAMERKMVTVHETNHVNELAIENISTEDVFVQAGDIVKGGRQDRVLSVDMILSAKSGMVPISAFCVEPSRWHSRGAESVDHFTLTEMVATPSLRKVIVDVATQAGVWSEVQDSQEKLGAGLARSVRSEESPTSLPLTLESEAVQETTALYLAKLLPIVHQWNDVIGFAFAINDELRVADVYGSKIMFKQFWPRLLKAAAVEAIATPPMKRAPNALPIETVGASLVNMELAAATVTVVNARTHSIKRETEDGLFFESVDTKPGTTWIHRSYLSRLKE